MTDPIDNIVVLGAGYAGLACAFAFAAEQPDRRVTLVDAREEFSERIRLHQLATGQTLPRRSLTELCAGTSVRFVRARVDGIDRSARSVRTSAGELSYDRLVVALGSAGTADIPGVLEHAHAIDVESRALRLAGALDRLGPGAEVAIIGAGTTGIELSAEIAERRSDLVVTLVARGALGHDLLSAGGVARLRRSFARLGVRVVEDFDAAAIESRQVIGRAGVLPFDVCVYTGGFAPSPLVAELGLPVDNTGRLLVDAYGRAPQDRAIYGIGDAAVPADWRGASPLMSCRLALPRGVNAAANLAAECRGDALRPWRIFDAGRSLSLGRHDGLVQLHAGDGRIRNASFGGVVAAWLKEQICRYTVATLLRARNRARKAVRSLPSGPTYATLEGA